MRIKTYCVIICGTKSAAYLQPQILGHGLKNPHQQTPRNIDHDTRSQWHLEQLKFITALDLTKCTIIYTELEVFITIN